MTDTTRAPLDERLVSSDKIVSDLQSRIDRAAAILRAAPDLDLKDYSKTQAVKLARAMLAAYAELTPNEHPPSRRNARGSHVHD